MKSTGSASAQLASLLARPDAAPKKFVVTDLEPVCLWQDAKYRVVRRKASGPQMGIEIVIETCGARDAMGGISWRDAMPALTPAGENAPMFHILEKITMDLIAMTNAVAASQEKK